jgi:hypothetical protein
VRLLRKKSLLDVRFRVCDGSHDALRAELRLGGRLTAKALVSTSGGCRPYRVVTDARRNVTLRLIVRNAEGRASATVQKRLR